MLGLAEGAFSIAVPYTYNRKQFGQPVGAFQSMAHQIASAATKIETARLLIYTAARRNEMGLNFVKEAAMAKWWAGEVAGEVSGKAIEWMGGIGFTREAGVEKLWRDSKIVIIICSPFKQQINNCTLGSNLRRNVEHSVANYCQVHRERIQRIIGLLNIIINIVCTNTHYHSLTVSSQVGIIGILHPCLP
jgi:hypothetical protein